MSLKYTLFGIPSNLDEAIDRVQRTGEIPEVYVSRKIVNSLDPFYRPFQYTVGLAFGKTKVPVHRWKQSFPNFVQGIDDARWDFVDADCCARERAEDLVAQISQRAIPVFYAGDLFVPAF